MANPVVSQQQVVVHLGQTHIADEELVRGWRLKEFHHGVIVRGAHINVEIESSVPEHTNEGVNGRGIILGYKDSRNTHGRCGVREVHDQLLLTESPVSPT